MSLFWLVSKNGKTAGEFILIKPIDQKDVFQMGREVRKF